MLEQCSKPRTATRHPSRWRGRIVRRVELVVALFAFLIPAISAAAAATPDFKAVHDEIIRTLTSLIQIDTSAGNETKAAEFLKAALAKEGVESEILEKESGRGNLIARLKGNGKKKPLLLMGHLDVVGVERDKWTVDPFAGVIKDDYLYGRGASDDKAMLSVCFEVFRLLHRLKTPLDRDVIFLAEAGEEGATHVGMDFLVREHWDKLACEYALNEGGVIRKKAGRVQFVGVATTEKVPAPGFLYAKGTGGHGSRPLADNAIVHLAQAVAKVGTWQAPLRLNDTTRTFFQRLASISSPEEAFLFTQLEDLALGPLVQEKLRVRYPGYNSMLRTSISPNVMQGGNRINVIPGDAFARLDIRMLPDENLETFAATLRTLIDNPRVELVVAAGPRKPTAPSRIDTEMFQALERAQRKLFPGAITLPMMLTGATDSAFLRTKGVEAYGLGTVSAEDDSTRVHGHDERVSIPGLRPFLEFVYEATIDIAAAR